jgi:hypothetical protein
MGGGMKVNKQEILAMMVAVELYVKADHKADWREFERRVRPAAKQGIEVAVGMLQPGQAQIVARAASGRSSPARNQEGNLESLARRSRGGPAWAASNRFDPIFVTSWSPSQRGSS